MFRFEHSAYLYGLLLIPILALLFYVVWMLRTKRIGKMGDVHLVKRLMPDYSPNKQWIKIGFYLLALTCFVLAWANPQWGTKTEKVKRKSVDVMLALDISESMLAEDISPSRLDRAKRFTQNLIEELRGERIGLILFAGNAYLQMPLTTDYSAAQLFVRSANTSLAATQGTAISDAVDLAERSFAEDNKSHKVLIVISDGENHDQETIERVAEARGNGLITFTLGVGTEQGGQIPAMVAGRKSYKRDNKGAVINTKLNEVMMNDIAEKGGGAYFNIANGYQIIDVLEDKIANVEKRELEQRVFNEYESYFHYFLAMGLLFLFLEFILTNKRSGLLEGRTLFNTN